MASPSAAWHWRNNPSAAPVSPLGRPFTIAVPPDTDIWRPSRHKNTFTAPFLYTTVKASRFRSARVTVSAAWKTLYDQGGILISFRGHPRAPNPSSSSPTLTPSLWTSAGPDHASAGIDQGIRFIKAGIEFFEGEAHLGVVGSDRLSDWSLAPISPGPHPDDNHQHHNSNNRPSAHDDAGGARTVAATIMVSRDGPDGWVFALDGPEGRRRALRQLTWAFQDGLEDVEIDVGIYGAKPTREGRGHEHEGIAVSFLGFALEVE
ncbi:Uncharacterized protein ESCO_000967 [Escovopsis weberi]|uniref:Uncharacterized protein n=1 Tax=Escovopsis weberi TaxID=150374 RepID=A0A0N0RT95_ESCWE|nr:Uncharacterized protein ESCO_000967 [Escovopsis weberi]